MEAMDGIPPQIPGYTFAQKLGSGSEANVYLYPVSYTHLTLPTNSLV